MSIPIECAYNLWRMRNIVIQMLAIRKYQKDTIVSLAAEDGNVQREYSWEEWCEYFDFQGDPYKTMDPALFSEVREKMSLSCLGRKEEKVAIFWYPSSKLGIKNAENLLKRLSEYNVIILVHNSKISPDAKQFFKNIKKRYLDIFMDRELFINITEHPLYSKHIICSKAKSKKLYEIYHIRQEVDEYPGLPLILKDDPVVKFIGGRIGDLIKIIRPSYTQISPEGTKYTTITYRQVVQ